jgi:DNA (cytosine-5)-methyltransferase 1
MFHLQQDVSVPQRGHNRQLMKTISLFSGCGGMDIGAEAAGADVVFANDSAPDAARTYRMYFSDGEFVEAPVSSIRAFPQADLVIGGYPCQSFSMGGVRRPGADERTQLYLEFARCLDQVSPMFFVAENVSGLKKLRNGRFLEEQLKVFSSTGSHGYSVAWKVIHAEDYGIPQRRKRVVIIGIRRDLGLHYWFPPETHAKPGLAERRGLMPWASHGDVIAGMPLWPENEFYERPHDPEGHWAWYYMSRNRKARWDGPSFTIVANWRHVTLHPASPVMKLTWSNLADGWKQRWDFSNEYEHVEGHPERPVLDEPRRLSWRECARIQTFPEGFEPSGTVMSKFEQIGNAVPPELAKTLLRPLGPQRDAPERGRLDAQARGALLRGRAPTAL